MKNSNTFIELTSVKIIDINIDNDGLFVGKPTISTLSGIDISTLDVPGYVHGFVPVETLLLKTPTQYNSKRSTQIKGLGGILSAVMSNTEGVANLPLNIIRMVEAKGGIYMTTLGSPISYPRLVIVRVNIVMTII